jgi:DMSO/TMAO reductase YedYZ molybdopterin-dependent catalytic subunit/thiosulfate reductase cytochrome b subunit
MDHPKLYWKDDSKDGSEWLKLSKKQMPEDKLWTSMDEAEEPKSKILAMPGGFHNLGAARNWHLIIVTLWVVTGFVYVGLLFITGGWHQLIPGDWGVFARALDTLKHYLTFHIPPAADFRPFDPLQQLAYAGVVFLLAPFMIATGLAMSPSFVGRFPGYLKLFGGKQKARSFHFLGLIGLALFTIIHVTMVFLVYFPKNIRSIVFGSQHSSLTAAIVIASAALLLIILFNIWATYATLRGQRRWQKLSTAILHPLLGSLLGRTASRQRYTKKDVTNNFRINGYPPTTQSWLKLKENDFRDWKLSIGGLVGNKLQLSLKDLKALRKQEQITKHNCIQGWTAVGEWGGVPMKDIIELAKPDKRAKYVAFYGYDTDEKGHEYYETIELRDALDPLTILAYEFNGKTLPAEHGAPLRLRCEQKYGYKMVKYLKEIRFVEDYRDLGQGAGGYREDWQYYDRIAAI